MKEYSFYFFSTELYSPELPVKCSFVKQLITDDRREAILAKCDVTISAYSTDYLVLTPKSVGKSLYLDKSREPVFAYVFDGKNFAGDSDKFEKFNYKHVLDWGGITILYETAVAWQVKP